jgi:hypothetical protein
MRETQRPGGGVAGPKLKEKSSGLIACSFGEIATLKQVDGLIAGALRGAS